MANRYNKSKIFRDENGTQYLNRIEYPAIPIRDDDVFIRGIFGAAVSFGISFFTHDDALVLATTIFILCCLATLSICTQTYKQ